MLSRPAFALLIGLACLDGALAATPLALHGLALGMTPDQAAAVVHLPCSKPAFSTDLDCRDESDGSDYRTTFSAGDPSVALSVQRSFCSSDTKQSVLKSVLADLKVGADRAHQDPNGYHVDLDGNNEAILNADDGTCKTNGAKHYIYLIRSNGLLIDSGKQAVERAKAALH
jgi:hypothetical protein